MDSLSQVVRLEEENKEMKSNISNLLNVKEDSILVKFNLEKRLKE
jgi:2C-methyl-D-erythritol 2,4-cyclodiphosphate synthase